MKYPRLLIIILFSLVLCFQPAYGGDECSKEVQTKTEKTVLYAMELVVVAGTLYTLIHHFRHPERSWDFPKMVSLSAKVINEGSKILPQTSRGGCYAKEAAIARLTINLVNFLVNPPSINTKVKTITEDILMLSGIDNLSTPDKVAIGLAQIISSYQTAPAFAAEQCFLLLYIAFSGENQQEEMRQLQKAITLFRKELYGDGNRLFLLAHSLRSVGLNRYQGIDLSAVILSSLAITSY